MSVHVPLGANGGPDEPVPAKLPEALPILPLRDSVPFPETLTPLIELAMGTIARSR